MSGFHTYSPQYELDPIGKIVEKIVELEQVLLAGETSVTIDGTTTSIDLDLIRQNLALLYRQKEDLEGSARRKPKIASIRVGGLY